MKKWFIPIILLLLITSSPVWAQDTPTFTADSTTDWTLDSLNAHAGGMLWVNNRFLVWDTTDEKFFAYQADGTRDANRDLAISGATGIPSWDGTHINFSDNFNITPYTLTGVAQDTVTFPTVTIPELATGGGGSRPGGRATTTSASPYAVVWEGDHWLVLAYATLTGNSPTFSFSQRGTRASAYYTAQFNADLEHIEGTTVKIAEWHQAFCFSCVYNNDAAPSVIIESASWDGKNWFISTDGSTAATNTLDNAILIEDNTGNYVVSTLKTPNSLEGFATADGETYFAIMTGNVNVLGYTPPADTEGILTTPTRTAPLPTAPPLPTADPDAPIQIPPFAESIPENGIYTPTAPQLTYFLENADDETGINVVFEYSRVSGVDNYEIYGIPTTGTEIVDTLGCAHTIIDARDVFLCTGSISTFTIGTSGSGSWDVRIRGRREARSEETYVPRPDGTSAYIAENIVVYTPFSPILDVNYFRQLSIEIPTYTPQTPGVTAGQDGSQVAEEAGAALAIVSELGERAGLQESQAEAFLTLLWFSGAALLFVIPTAIGAAYNSQTIGAALGTGLSSIMLTTGPAIFDGIPLWTSFLPIVLAALVGVSWIIGRIRQNR